MASIGSPLATLEKFNAVRNAEQNVFVSFSQKIASIIATAV